ncbi:hypothetical protein MHTCC0001_16150 [Flavobacteriaceae bacterium MHTCC 0001]
MKKFLLLLLLISGAVQSQSGTKYHKFYSVINGQTITEQFANDNCGNTYTTSQLRGRNYVNIEIDTPLQAGKFYQLDFGQGLKYYYLSYSRSTPHGDEDYTLRKPYNINSICSYKSHTFYSALRSPYTVITEQVATSKCGQTFSSSNLTGRFYVNIQIGTKLKPGRFYYLDFGRGYNYYYLYQSSNNQHSDEDYRMVDNGQIASVCPDSDNDGVLDAIDNCPTQPGPSSNNGCPLPDDDNDGVVNIYDDCPNQAGPSSNNGCPYKPDFIPSSRKITKDDDTYEFCATIKNIGQGTGRPHRVQLILSTHADLDAWGVVNADLAAISLSGNIAPNESKDFCFSQNGDDFLGRPLAFYKYIHVLIDQGTEESNTDNNDKAFSVYISSSKQSSTFTKTKNVTIDDSINNSYNLSIYSFSGALIKSLTISTIEEQKNIIKTLPPGLYIIKTPNETNKIIK